MAAFASTRTPPRGTRGGLVPATFALRIAPKSIVGQHLVRLFCFLAGQLESQGGLQLLLCFLLLTNSRKDHTEGGSGTQASWVLSRRIPAAKAPPPQITIWGHTDRERNGPA